MSMTPTRPDVLTALDWAARVEMRSHLLVRWPRQRAFRYAERVAVSATVSRDQLPERLFPHTSAASLLDLAVEPGESRSSADVTVLGVMRADYLRFRSFYLSGLRQRSTPLTLAVHEQVPGPGQTTLLAGVQIAREAQGRIGLTVPRVVDLGELPAGRYGPALEWALKEVVNGSPIPPDKVADAVPHLLHGVQQLWRLREVSQAPLGEAAATRAQEELRRLARLGPELGLWPDDVDRPRVVERALSLVQERPVLTYGLTHGDPGVGNSLLLDDGGLALLDWEHAAVRHLCHDAMKVLAAPTVNPSSWPHRMPELPGRGGAPANLQLAIATLLFLTGWQSRTRRAVKRGAEAANRARVQRLLGGLQALLDA